MKRAISVFFAFTIFICFTTRGSEDLKVKQSTGELKEVTGEGTWKDLRDKYFSENESNRKNRYEQSARLYRITVVDENAIVFFTKDTHPAHPSFAKISLVKGEGNSMTVRTFGFTWGHRKSYEKFMREEILEFGKGIARQIQESAKK